jgi:hypothetical protein
MVALARDRTERFGARATVVLSDGSPPLREPSEAYDRFVSCFVLDLLSDADIDAVLREAHRMLAPGGLLCLTSLATGSGPVSRLLAPCGHASMRCDLSWWAGVGRSSLGPGSRTAAGASAIMRRSRRSACRRRPSWPSAADRTALLRRCIRRVETTPSLSAVELSRSRR